MNDIIEKVQTPDQMAKRFLTIKEKKAEVSKLKKALDNEYNKLRDDLLKVTQQLDVKTLKTSTYMIQRYTDKRLKIESHSEAIKHLKKLGYEPVLKLDYFANAQALKNQPVNGVTQVETERIRVKEVK